MKDFTFSITERPLPAMPTTYPPGSPGKEAVFCSRLSAGTQLHHPADARYEGDTLPHQWYAWQREQKRKEDSEATQRIFDKIKARKLLENKGVAKESVESLP